jgi:FMN phosphatase YigB (HAD superfamily)
LSIKCVLFDFGNTLISIELDWKTIIPRNIASLVQYLNSKGIPADIESFGKAFVANKSSNHTHGQSVMMEYPTTQTLADTLTEFKYSALSATELEAAVTAFFQPEESLYPIVPHTHEVLEQLKSRGYKLGIVSNASSGKLIRDAMDHRGFTPYFDSVIV